MAERIDLTTPLPSVSRWFIHELSFRRGQVASGGVLVIVPGDSAIRVELLAENGQTLTHRWTGTTADTLIIALNKANLSAGNTLNKRTLDRLIADGVLDGTSAGTPD